jgi:hypothetical protein
VVLCGCETCSLNLKEESSRRAFENRVLRRIFGPMGAKVIGGWTQLHNEELHKFYSSPCIIRMNKSRGRDGQGM